MLELSGKNIDSHLHRLREICKLRLRAPQNVTFRFERVSWKNIIEVRLTSNSYTEIVSDDFDRPTVCAKLCQVRNGYILCSYGETWEPRAKDRYELRSSGLKFFLAYCYGDERSTKQIFRLEWENWRLHTKPTKAAYPHWQFDRWLTASDTDMTLDEAMAALSDSPDVEMVFVSAEHGRPPRPNLSWFTRVHFPACAQWTQKGIVNMSNVEQSHRAEIKAIRELENWVESALFYVSSEVTSYAPEP